MYNYIFIDCSLWSDYSKFIHESRHKIDWSTGSIMRRISSKGDLDLITERREKREKITNDHVEFYTPTKAPESKDCHEVITQQREKREKSTDDVLEFCTPIKAPELDRNGSPRTIFSNHEFGYLCRNSSSKQRTETPQRRRVRSDGKYSLRTCIDQTNPYLGYFWDFASQIISFLPKRYIIYGI